jgi:hypothetical protein
MSLNRGPDGWSPISGTGYPYSGQAFVYSPQQGSLDPIQASAASGTANVSTKEDTSPANISIYVFVSGTVNPYQSSSWYQWQSGSGLLAGTPNKESTSNGGIYASGNSLYRSIPNQNAAPIQNSGTANVPQGESSWNV